MISGLFSQLDGGMHTGVILLFSEIESSIILGNLLNVAKSHRIEFKCENKERWQYDGNPEDDVQVNHLLPVITFPEVSKLRNMSTTCPACLSVGVIKHALAEHCDARHSASTTSGKIAFISPRLICVICLES